MFTIICKNTNNSIDVEPGTSLFDIQKQLFKEDPPIFIGALVNNKLRELTFKVYSPKTIQFLDINDSLGVRMYKNSLCFLLYKAVKDIYPESCLRIEHSTPSGFYCEIENLHQIEKEEVVHTLKQHMEHLIEKDIPFKGKVVTTEQATQLFNAEKDTDIIELIKSTNRLYTWVNYLDGTPGIFYTSLVPRTSYLSAFDLKSFDNNGGYLLQIKNEKLIKSEIKKEERSKLFKVYREHKKWLDILNIPYVHNLNDYIKTGKSRQMIQVSEALHEKRIAKIADEISKDGRKKVVLIAGPSSSGKTTTCRRVGVQLSVLGYTPQELSLDNYFVNRENTPKDANGEYDFESLEALDIELFNSNLLDLFEGKTIKIPRFDFISGRRFYNGETLSLKNNDILIVEGIHGLNPKLTAQIDNTLKYRIFASPVTQISIDRNNTIHSTDSRLIRRMVRDFNFRGYSAYDTLKRWESVTDGERKYIFPYQEQCDTMLNTSLMYELGVLKKYAEPILRTVPPNQAEYAVAVRLLKFLDLFESISDEYIPPTSIMREFLGNSSFTY